MLRILIADDHEIVRKGLKHILLEEFPFAHIEEAVDGIMLLEKALNADWDIVLCDIAMPNLNGIKALQQIKAKLPALPVLIISIQTEEQYSKTMLRAGASGYLSKDAAPKELVTAVQTILEGNKFFLSAAKNKTEAPETIGVPPHEQLSIRELEVLKLLANGNTLIQIGEALSLSPSTISTFRARIVKKLGVSNNAELTRYAVANNLI
jgi:two-component system invasion response regulator UvrY